MILLAWPTVLVNGTPGETQTRRLSGLSSADLAAGPGGKADLAGFNLAQADLSGARLVGASLVNADLRSVNKGLYAKLRRAAMQYRLPT